nr:immunoglobulin light chain junction region [Macaca mulatta]MOV61298.1 immunoglobulin light chain junction region [Macaca mulatta]MOV61719.1 immunoglobulin light chain junction region [Macaca mulatta]MOV62345.1 immunoglobulin light chain junction region [Macaca mulatta]MOV62729.1 immunoglobulin light chain junction region [Macaca mulatta]
CQQGFSYPLTF